MLNIFNWILNTLIRDLPQGMRVTISIVLFVCAVFSFMNSIKKKDDNSPLSIGWLVMCLIFLFISVLYMFI